jgi:hypothetical protein
MLGGAAFADEVGLAGDGGGCVEVGDAQGMFLNGRLQFGDGGIPVGIFLVESAGTELSDSIFQTARRHGLMLDEGHDGEDAIKAGDCSIRYIP